MEHQNQNIEKCFICGGELRYLLNGRDFLYKTTEKNFKVYKCIKCKLEQIVPIPTKEEIKLFYPNNYYSYNMMVVENKKKSFFIKLREKIIESAYNKNISKDVYYFLALIAKPFFDGLPLNYMGNRNLLDIGCGDGYNLNLMKKYGWNCYGFEVGEKKKINNIYYDNNLFDVNFGGLKFDYIRIWHVLEHVAEPLRFMEKLKTLLSDKGEIVIGVPNTNGLYANLFGKYWYNRDIPRHIINYNVNNLKLFLNKNSFKVRKVKYISTGGFLGSLQHLINDKLKTKTYLIKNVFLVLLLYPLDLLCNLFKRGDLVAFTVIKNNNESSALYKDMNPKNET